MGSAIITPKYVVNISGGKDSTALLLWMLERCEDIIPVFADTGNELPTTLEYIQRLIDLFVSCPPLRIVRADFRKELDRAGRPYTGNPMLDLCMWKGIFPRGKIRFCTSFLKVYPIHEQVVAPLVEAGHEVVIVVGVRADESRSREGMLRIEELGGGVWIWRPLLEWTAEQVFAYLDRNGIDPHHAYRQGMRRVGCAPCIMAAKDDIRSLATRYPEEIDRIRLWEQHVRQHGRAKGATFFPPAKAVVTKHGGTVDDVVSWAMTSHGGRQLDLFAQVVPTCSSAYGLCE